MGNISSINFKKSKFWQTIHNAEKRPSYVIVSEDKIEFDRNSNEANKLREKIIKEVKEAYKKTFKRAFVAKDFEYSAVINLNETHTRDDVNNVIDFFETKYGFQCYQWAIHRGGLY